LKPPIDMNYPVGVCPKAFKTIHPNTNKAEAPKQICTFKAHFMRFAVELKVYVPLDD